MSETTGQQRIQVAGAVVVLEAVALLVFGIAELAELDKDRASVALTTGVFFCLYAVGLALAARGFLRLRSWSRGPVVLAQLIQLGVAWSFLGNDTVWVAIVLAVPAIGVLVVALSPATTELLYRGSQGDEESGVPSP